MILYRLNRNNQTSTSSNLNLEENKTNKVESKGNFRLIFSKYYLKIDCCSSSQP